jgi:hypothetical protein
MWGLAAASKLYPLALLVLFLSRRKFRALGIAVVVFVVVSVGCMAFMGPDLATAWRGTLLDVFGYQNLRASEWTLRELNANHSAFLLVKVVAAIAGRSALGLTGIYYVCGVVGFLAVFFWRLRKMPVANQLLGVTVFMLTLPTISYFHTLVNLYVPLVMLLVLAIRAERDGLRVAGLSGTILLFVPLFAAYSLMTFPSVLMFCGVVQCVVLMGLGLCALQYPFGEIGAQTTVGCECK